jgi:hypothetical protein
MYVCQRGRLKNDLFKITSGDTFWEVMAMSATVDTMSAVSSHILLFELYMKPTTSTYFLLLHTVYNLSRL